MVNFVKDSWLRNNDLDSYCYLKLIDKPKEASLIQPKFYNDSIPHSDWQGIFKNTYAPYDLGVYICKNLIILPRQIILKDDGESLSELSFFRKGFMGWHGTIEESNGILKLRYPDILSQPIIQKKELYYYLDSDYVDIYGHTLIEVIPRLWAYSKFSGQKLKIIGSTKPSSVLKDFFDLLGVPFDLYEQITNPTKFENIIIPDMPLYKREWVHPIVLDMYDSIKDNVLRNCEFEYYEKIYISRSKVNNRKLLNEVEVEDYFKSENFKIIYPEELSLKEQIYIFSKADIIVGSGGSAMHNAVFSKKSAKVLILCSEGWFVNADIILNQVKNKLGYVFGQRIKKNSRRDGNAWNISIDDVKKGYYLHCVG